MAVVVAGESISQNGIVKLAGVDRSTLSDTMQRLQACGYVKRVLSSTDRRTWTVTATSAGCNAFERSRDAAMEIEAEMLNLIPAVERKWFVQTLDALRSCAAAVSIVS